MLVVAHTNRSIDIFRATGFQLSQQPRIAGRRAHEAVLAPALQYPGRGDLLRSGARHRHQQRVQISRRETASSACRVPAGTTPETRRSAATPDGWLSIEPGCQHPSTVARRFPTRPAATAVRIRRLSVTTSNGRLDVPAVRSCR
jgi:hypothetical protein